MSSIISLWSIHDANKLIGPNFLDWYWNLRILFKQDRRLYVLESHIPRVLDDDAFIEVKIKYHCYIDDDDE